MAKIQMTFNPDDEETPEGQMPNGVWTWHLRDDNGEIICQGEGHHRPEDLQDAVDNVAMEFVKLAAANSLIVYTLDGADDGGPGHIEIERVQ